MPEILDHVAYLSQQIGPRPAGTEEEQQAALYITEQMQKEAGLSAVIEDFSGAGSADAPRAICCGATLVVAVLALFLSVMAIPALIVSLIALLLLVAEVLDRPVLSKAFARGVSQNVVAKYEPGYTAEAGGSRRRKIILVARYDSGKVRSELKQPFLSALPVLRWVNLGAMVAVPLLLVLRATLFLHATGTTEIVLNVLMAIVLVFVALPVLEAAAHKFAAYNEAANCNASGVSVLLDVARRVGRGRVSEAELAARAEGAAIHGEEAARAAGLVPEGVEIVYAASNVKPPEPAPQSEAARLAAAKAAVAALTGKPVSGRLSTDLAENLVQVKEPPLPSPTDVDFQAQRGETREAFTTIPAETVQAALANAEAAALSGAEAAAAAAAGIPAPFPAPSAPAAEPVSSDGVPDWFKKAQEKAKKPVDNKQVHRSRYADALDAALGDNAEGASEEPSAPLSDMEARLQTMREGIMEVKAPQASRADESTAEGQAEALASTVTITVDGGAAETAPAQASTAVPEVRFETPDGTAAPDAGATCAMPPIDVSALRLGDVPPVGDVPMPSFLDPAKAQAEKLEERGEVNRTANRVDVTAAPIGDSGRIDLQPTQDALSTQAACVPAPASPADGEGAPALQRRPIVLPDIGVAAANLTPITELPKQRAPLAEAETSGKSAAKSLLTMLPSIEPASNAVAPAADAAVPAAPAPQRPDLRAALPSLSGAIARPDDAAVSTAGAFVPAAPAHSPRWATNCSRTSIPTTSTWTMPMTPPMRASTPKRAPSRAPATWKCRSRAHTASSTSCASASARRKRSPRRKNGSKSTRRSMPAPPARRAAAGRASARTRTPPRTTTRRRTRTMPTSMTEKRTPTWLPWRGRAPRTRSRASRAPIPSPISPMTISRSTTWTSTRTTRSAPMPAGIGTAADSRACAWAVPTTWRPRS